MRELGAKQQQVMEVNHIWSEIAQQLRYVRHNTIKVDLNS